MSYFIALSIILISIFSLQYLLKAKLEIIFPIVNLSIITILYIFGLCHQLFFGGIIILLLSLLIFVYSLIKIIRTKDSEFVKSFFSPTFYILCAFCLLQFVALIGMRPNWWDELSHWGLVVKNMFFFKDFGGGDLATTMFKGYPVGTSLYLYFFQMFGKTFTDGFLFMALNLINISLLLPILAKFKETNKKITLLLTMIVMAFVMHINFLSNICNDMFLSLSFSFIMIMYFCFKTEQNKNIYYTGMFLSTFVLCIAKSTGLALVAFAYFVILLDILSKNKFKQLLKSKKTYLFLTITILSILIPKLSWSIYLKISNTQIWATDNLTIKNILNFFIHPTSYQLKILGRFLLNLIIPVYVKGNGGTGLIPFIVYVFIFIMLIKRISTGDKKGKIVLNCGIFISSFAWLISLLVLYIFTFTEREALTLSSSIRYINTLTNGFLIFLLSYYWSKFGLKIEFKFTKKSLTITASVVCALFLTYGAIRQISVQITYADFKYFEEYVSTLNQDDSVYIINCNHTYSRRYVYAQSWKEPHKLQWVSHITGQESLMFRYLSTPIDASGFKIGGSPHIGDMWWFEMDVSDTKTAILKGGYNYLYLHQIDDDFIQNYQSMFDETPTSQSFYKIVWENDELNLIKV